MSAQHFSGVGDPNGVVFGNPGDIYQDESPGTTTFWTKASGVGTATGWVALGSLAASNVLTFRPGSGATGPIVFDSWTALYAQLVALRVATDDSGEFTIVFDETDGALLVPAGAYDMDRTSWISVHGDQGGGFSRFNTYFVTIDDGVTITNLLSITGLAVRQGAGATPSIQLGTDPLHLYGATLQGGDNGSLCTIAGPSAGVQLGDYGSIGGGDEAQAAIFVPTGTGLNVWLAGAGGDQRSINEYAFNDDGGGGSIQISPTESSSFYYQTQIYLTNQPFIYQQCPMWRWEGDPNGWVTSSTLRFLIVDQLTGTVWRNIGGTVWVIDGPRVWSYDVTGNVALPAPTEIISVPTFTSESGKRYTMRANASVFGQAGSPSQVDEFVIMILRDPNTKGETELARAEGTFVAQADTDVWGSLMCACTFVGDGSTHDYAVRLFWDTGSGTTWITTPTAGAAANFTITEDVNRQP